MPVSKKRGGAKTHRLRVKKRNINLTNAKTNFQKQYTKLMEEKLEEMKSKFSAETETNNVSEND
jgi:hypothetical protein